MLGTLSGLITTLAASKVPLAELAPTMSVPIAPALLMLLCVIGGVGTVLLLPGRREASIRAIGGIILLATGLILAATLIRWTAGESRGGMGFYFWFFSAIAIVAAVRVVTHTKPVYSALYFVLTVFATAGLFILLWAEFMAAALVLIYAGAILVTYVFVIMLAAEAASPAGAETRLDSVTGVLEHDTISREPLAACAGGFALLGVLLFVIFDKYQASSVAAAAEPNPTLINNSTQALGHYLFTNQTVSLELAGLILTIAMVGAIVISRKRVIHTDAAGRIELKPDVISSPATPVDDNPHSIPVEGVRNPRQKAYPET